MLILNTRNRCFFFFFWVHFINYGLKNNLAFTFTNELISVVKLVIFIWQTYSNPLQDNPAYSVVKWVTFSIDFCYEINFACFFSVMIWLELMIQIEIFAYCHLPGSILSMWMTLLLRRSVSSLDSFCYLPKRIIFMIFGAKKEKNIMQSIMFLTLYFVANYWK